MRKSSWSASTADDAAGDGAGTDAELLLGTVEVADGAWPGAEAPVPSLQQ